MRTLRQCVQCKKYMFSAPQNIDDNFKERLQFCQDCWNFKVNKGRTLNEIENENMEMSEKDKQVENSQEEYRGQRWRAS